MEYKQNGFALIGFLISILAIGAFIFFFLNTIQGKSPFSGLPGVETKELNAPLDVINRAQDARDALNARDKVIENELSE